MNPDRFGLHTDHTAGRQGRAHGLVKGGLKETFRGSHRIGRITDNHVILFRHALLLRFQKGGRVGVHDRHPLIVKVRCRVEIFLGHVNDHGINFHHRDGLHRRSIVLRHDFAQRPAVAPSHNQHVGGPACRAKAAQRQVHHHLVVGEFVARRALNDTVQDQDVAVLRAAKDEYGLERGGFGVENGLARREFLQGEGELLTRPQGKSFGFGEPAILIDAFNVGCLLVVGIDGNPRRRSLIARGCRHGTYGCLSDVLL